jgi:hypothetical protein
MTADRRLRLKTIYAAGEYSDFSREPICEKYPEEHPPKLLDCRLQPFARS